MADHSNSNEKTRPTIVVDRRSSQKIIQPSSPDARPSDVPIDPERSASTPKPSRNYITGPLPKLNDDKNIIPESAPQLRSQSLSQIEASALTSRPPLSSKASLALCHGNIDSVSNVISPPITPGLSSANTDRATSEAITKPQESRKGSPGPPRLSKLLPSSKAVQIPYPRLPNPNTAPDVEQAPTSGMYWSIAPVSGTIHNGIRAHTLALIGSNIYMFGGCNSKSCFNELYVIDADSFYLSCPYVCGDIPVPLRAMTCTAVGKKLIVFGGGDGPAYYNDVYVLDTVNFRWSKPKIVGERQPSKRRAHTACLWQNGIYIFGGGDGIRALNDIWRLDVSDISKMSWKLISPPSSGTTEEDNKPKARGYHTANMIGSKLIIYGGSDGGECFQDVWVFDVETLTFSPVHIPISYPRLSHSATIVGSYLFVIGGHDGTEYSNEVLLLNLVSMVWDKRRIYGQPPRPRGYHGTVLYDSRLIVVGGFDGQTVFADVMILELAVHAYYSQISHFIIDV